MPTEHLDANNMGWAKYANDIIQNPTRSQAASLGNVVTHATPQIAPVQLTSQGGIQGVNPMPLTAPGPLLAGTQQQSSASSGVTHHASQTGTVLPNQAPLTLADITGAMAHLAPNHMANPPLLASTDSTGRSVAFASQAPWLQPATQASSSSIHMPAQHGDATALTYGPGFMPMTFDQTIMKIDQYLAGRVSTAVSEPGVLTLRFNAQGAVQQTKAKNERASLIRLATGFRDFTLRLGMQAHSDGNVFSIAGNANAQRLLIHFAYLIATSSKTDRPAVDKFVMDISAGGTSGNVQQCAVDKLIPGNVLVLKAFREKVIAATDACLSPSVTLDPQRKKRFIANNVYMARRFATGFLHVRELIAPSVSALINEWKNDAAAKLALTTYQGAFCAEVESSVDIVSRFMTFLDTDSVTLTASDLPQPRMLARNAARSDAAPPGLAVPGAPVHGAQQQPLSAPAITHHAGQDEVTVPQQRLLTLAQLAVDRGPAQATAMANPSQLEAQSSSHTQPDANTALHIGGLTDEEINNKVAAYMQDVNADSVDHQTGPAINRRITHQEPLSFEEEKEQVTRLAKKFRVFVSTLRVTIDANAFSIRGDNVARRLLENCAHILTSGTSAQRVAMDNFIKVQSADASAAAEPGFEDQALDTVNANELASYGSALRRVTRADDNAHARTPDAQLTKNRGSFLTSEKSQVHKFVKGFLHIQPIIAAHVGTDMTAWKNDSASILALRTYQQICTQFNPRIVTATNRYITYLETNEVTPPTRKKNPDSEQAVAGPSSS